MRRGALRKVFRAFRTCFSGYCEYSQLHGFRNIARADARWYESLFWMGVCFLGVFMTAAMFSAVWYRYQLTPTITTIETNNFPIDNVPFPAITFCNVNKVLKSSFEIMARKFEDHGVDESVLREYVTEVFKVYFGDNQTFEHEELVKKVMNELGYNLESFAFDLAQPCSELLLECFWSGKHYDCSSLFQEVKTVEGFCCSFNWRGGRVNSQSNNSIRKTWKNEGYLFGKDKRPLLVNNANTIFTGLNVVVDPDEENYFTSLSSIVGCLVILHDANEYPDLGSRSYLIQERTETTLRLRASITESSNDVRNLRITQRRCYFDEEISVEQAYKYSYEACLTDCKMRSYLQRCGCIPFFYPNVTESLMCDLSGMRCIWEEGGIPDSEIAYEEYDFFQIQYRCGCLPSCNDIRYDWSAEVNEIRNNKHLSPVFGKDLRSRSIISLYFEQNVCIKYRLESLITWDSVIASFGGIFGLCLGGSIISLIELLYYIFYDYWKSCGREVAVRTKKVKRNKAACIKVHHRIVKGSRLHAQHSVYQNRFLAWIK